MEELGLCLHQWGLYYSGLFFDLPDPLAPKLPNATVYKIRMMNDMVDGTMQVHDRRWTGLNRDRPAFDLKYTTFGFAYIQVPSLPFSSPSHKMSKSQPL